MAIEIEKFKSYQKGTLQAFVTLRLTSIGLEIDSNCIEQACLRRLKDLYESQISQDFEPTLSWKLDVINFLIQRIEDNLKEDSISNVKK